RETPRNAMTQKLRPALPAFILLLNAVMLGVPASYAQSKGTARKKPMASTTKSSSGKAATARSTAAKSPAKAPAKTGLAKGPATQKASGATTASRSAAATSKSGKRSSRSRRQPGQKAPTSDRVIQIQSALAKDGSYTGAPDGKWNDDTTAAM